MLADTTRRYGEIFKAFAFNADPFGVEIPPMLIEFPPKIYPFGLHSGGPGGVQGPTSFLDRYSPLRGSLWSSLGVHLDVICFMIFLKKRATISK